MKPRPPATTPRSADVVRDQAGPLALAALCIAVCELSQLADVRPTFAPVLGGFATGLLAEKGPGAPPVEARSPERVRG